jgi:outer membrane protein OmpA-like peptidoglycan-associated protein
MRRALLTFFTLAFVTNGAVAQSLRLEPGSNFPVLGFPTQQDDKPDTYKRLPYRDLANEIRIQLAADALYDFDQGKIRSSAADYMQQAANLIFERAKGPVRIECRSDRSPPALAQKFAAQCAAAIAQWLIVQEKLTKVKFTTLGLSVPPPAAGNPDDPLAPAAASQSNITIVFAKQ